MNITFIGTGYVGLVGAACLAEVGNHVLGLDLNPEKIRILKEGGVPIHEPGLLQIVRRNIKNGRLSFTNNIEEAVHFGDIQFIAVGTPPDQDGSADLQYVTEAARNIGRFMTQEKIIVDKSTVPIGTGDKVSEAITKELKKRNINIHFSVVSNPEFLKEGAAVDDFMRPDRIVIGTEDPKAIEVMKELYAPFQRNHQKIVVTNIRSAELIKYAANSMLATRISFMNELANLAEIVNADIEMVRQGIGSDKRIGYDFLYAGCGYGGSCFPKDVKALIKTAKDVAGYDLKLLKAVEEVNDLQKYILSEKIKKQFGKNLKGKHFALWGLAFKANTDDMREASSLILIKELIKAGATVAAFDPIAMIEAKRIFKDEKFLSFTENQNDVLKNADALIIVTEWSEFRSPDFSLIKSSLKSPIIFDGRNLYDPKAVRALGFKYYPIGR